MRPRARDLHAAPRRLDRAGAGERLDRGRRADARLPAPGRGRATRSTCPRSRARPPAQIRPYLVLGEKLGRFQGQLCTGSIEQIEIEYSGDAARARRRADHGRGAEGPARVGHRPGEHGERAGDRAGARHQGDRVEGQPHARTSPARSRTRVTGCVDRLIVGAVFQGRQPRIVRIDDFMLEAIPEGPTLLHPQPRPARRRRHGRHDPRQGAASTSRACSSRSQRERGEAAMLVNVDAAPPDAVLERCAGCRT